MVNDQQTVRTKLSKGIENFFTSIDLLLAQQASKFDVSLSGTTLTLVFVILDRIYCGAVGDSRAIVVHELSHSLVFEELSKDHKPQIPEEQSRILSLGGKIEPLRSRLKRL